MDSSIHSQTSELSKHIQYKAWVFQSKQLVCSVLVFRIEKPNVVSSIQTGFKTEKTGFQLNSNGIHAVKSSFQTAVACVTLMFESSLGFSVGFQLNSSEIAKIKPCPISTQLFPSLRWVDGAQRHSPSKDIFLLHRQTQAWIHPSTGKRRHGFIHPQANAGMDSSIHRQIHRPLYTQ
jgi:hypothetical protein